MKDDVTLTITSLLSIMLFTFHWSDEISRRMESGTTSSLGGISTNSSGLSLGLDSHHPRHHLNHFRHPRSARIVAHAWPERTAIGIAKSAYSPNATSLLSNPYRAGSFAIRFAGD